MIFTKNFVLTVILIPFLVSCQNTSKGADSLSSFYKNIEIDTLFLGEIQIRALDISDKKVWYAGSGGQYGFCDLETKKQYKALVVHDTIFPHFRGIATTDNAVFLMGIATPGLLYKVEKETRNIWIVYKNEDPSCFFNGIHFWDDTQGIVAGDFIDGCLGVWITTNSGNDWERIPCDQLPLTSADEAGFSASNSHMKVIGDQVWIATGGKKARILYSKNRGLTWDISNTPMISGEASKGIFSIDFYDIKIGIAVGGDYLQPSNKSKNKALTKNGGKSYELVADNEAFGYASCVKYFPNSDAKLLLACGPNGVYFSGNGGYNWEKILEDMEFHTLIFSDDHTAIVAGVNKIVRLKFIENR